MTTRCRKGIYWKDWLVLEGLKGIVGFVSSAGVESDRNFDFTGTGVKENVRDIVS